MVVFADDQLHVHVINFMVNNKILGLCKLKAFPDNKTNVAAKLKIALGRVENKVEKKRKCWLPCFEAFPKQALVFTCLQHKSFENNVGKGEISLRAISPVLTVFSTHLENFPPYSSNSKFNEWVVGWLVVLGFNATLTAKVISWRSVTHMCFLAVSHQY